MKLNNRLSLLVTTSICIFTVSEIVDAELVENNRIEENLTTTESSAGRLDLSFITDDISAALIFHSSRFLRSDLITKIRGLELSLDNEISSVFPKLESVMFLYEKSLIDSFGIAEKKREFPITLVFTFEENINPDELFDPEIFGEMNNSKQDGLVVKVSSNPDLPEVFHFVDRRTLIATRSSLLTKMIEKRSIESILIKNLKKCQHSYDLIFAADRALPAGWVKRQVRRICPSLFQSELKLFRQLPYNTKIQSLMGGLNNETLMQITIEVEKDEIKEINKQFMHGLMIKQNMRQSSTRSPANAAFTVLSIDERKQFESLVAKLIEKTTSSTKNKLFTFSIPMTELFDQEPGLSLLIKILSARNEVDPNIWTTG